MHDGQRDLGPRVDVERGGRAEGQDGEGLQANFAETTASLGLTVGEGQVLHQLDEPAPMRAMADSLCCDASYITMLADRLEAQGLVNRGPDPGDRRVKRLILTEAGRALRGELLEAIHATTPALAGLDPAQRDILVGLLQTLAANSAVTPRAARPS